MTTMHLLSAQERLAEPRGSNILLLGQPGVGKTSLLRTLEFDGACLDLVRRLRRRRSLSARPAGRQRSP